MNNSHLRKPNGAHLYELGFNPQMQTCLDVVNHQNKMSQATLQVLEIS